MKARTIEGTFRLAILLGAGFSGLAGSPRTNQLFDEVPTPRSKWTYELNQIVKVGYDRWRLAHSDASPEEFLSWVRALDDSGLASPLWPSVVKFVGLRLTGAYIDYDPRNGGLIRWKHSIVKANREPNHVSFWRTVLHALPPRYELTVITTNYDIWIERSLRIGPRPRLGLPGFYYSRPGEILEGGPGFPVSQWAHPVYLSGDVPLLKLHGSISWERSGNGLRFFADCRPALKGQAAIVPPLREKERPHWLDWVWTDAEEYLRHADAFLAVGYSFPEYDTAVLDLLRDCKSIT